MSEPRSAALQARPNRRVAWWAAALLALAATAVSCTSDSVVGPQAPDEVTLPSSTEASNPANGTLPVDPTTVVPPGSTTTTPAGPGTEATRTLPHVLEVDLPSFINKIGAKRFVVLRSGSIELLDASGEVVHSVEIPQGAPSRAAAVSDSIVFSRVGINDIMVSPVPDNLGDGPFDGAAVLVGHEHGSDLTLVGTFEARDRTVLLGLESRTEYAVVVDGEIVIPQRLSTFDAVTGTRLNTTELSAVVMAAGGPVVDAASNGNRLLLAAKGDDVLQFVQVNADGAVVAWSGTAPEGSPPIAIDKAGSYIAISTVDGTGLSLITDEASQERILLADGYRLSAFLVVGDWISGTITDETEKPVGLVASDVNTSETIIHWYDTSG